MNKVSIFILAISLAITTANSPFQPTESPVTQNGCPNSPAGLKLGDIALVTDYQPSPLNLRVGPGLDQKIITEIPTGAMVTIISAPECADGYRWFEVGYNGHDGWSAEVGPDGSYYLIPSGSTNLPSGSPITVDPPSPQPIGVCINVYVKVNWDNNFRSMRIRFANEDWQEEATQEFQRVFCTHKYQPGVYKIRVEVAELGDNDWSHPEIAEVDYELKSIADFFPGQVAVYGTLRQIFSVELGSDVYVVYFGERWLVPNPETMEALCISREHLNPWNLSQQDILNRPRGPDIPDITREPDKFWAFKNKYFLPCDWDPNQTLPQIQPTETQAVPVPQTQPTETQIAPAPEQYAGQESPSENIPLWCRFFPLFCASPAQGATNIYCNNQCVPEARLHRPDMNIWAPRNSEGNTTSAVVLAAAEAGKSFLWDGQEQMVSVRDSLDVQAGDLVIWPQNCSSVTYLGGHIGYVESADGILITITDSNWGKPISPTQCSRRDSAQIQILPCMKFIASPFPVVNITSNQPIDKCSQHSGLNWLLCQIGLK